MIGGFFYGVISLLSFAAATLVVKKTVSSYDPIALATWRTFFTTLITFILCYALGVLHLPSKMTLLIIMFTGLVGAVGYVSFLIALSKANASIVSPFCHSYAIFTVLLSVMFHDELLSLFQAVSILIILLGVAVVSFDVGRIKDVISRDFKNAIPFIVSTIILWGVFYFMLKFIVADVGAFATTAYVEGLIFLFILPFGIRRISFERGLVLPGLAVGIGVFLGSLFFNMGLIEGYVSLIAPIVSSQSAIVVLGSILLLKEKLDLRKAAGIAMIIIGLLVISF